MSTAGNIGKLIEALQHQVAALEQELRETAGELEKCSACLAVERRAHTLELTAATALLERCSDEMNYDVFDDPAQRALQHDVEAFLYRAPAQPAAPTHDDGNESFRLVGGPWLEPADIDHTRCTPASGRLLGMSPIPRPAAPEPSGEPVGCCEGRAALVSRLMRAEDRVIAVQQIGIDAMKRAESAEAQLAAVAQGLDALIECVRTNYIEIIRTDDDSMVDGLDPELVEKDLQQIRALLNAPSPGAGEETL